MNLEKGQQLIIHFRSETLKVQFDITSIGKKHEKVGVYIEKNVNGTWKKVGYGTTVKPDKYDSALLYGLEAGKYRLALKTPKIRSLM